MKGTIAPFLALLAIPLSSFAVLESSPLDSKNNPALSDDPAVTHPLTGSIVKVRKFEVPANTFLVSGTVAAHKSVVLSAQMPGRVVFISGEEGDRFKRGTLLVKIDDDELLVKRQIALSQMASANSAMQNAGVQLHSHIVSPNATYNTPGGMGMPALFDQVVSNPMSSMFGKRKYKVERRADIMSKQSQLDQALIALTQAQSQIHQIDTLLRDTQSIAPFDGVIVTKPVEVGDTVQPGQTLMVFEDLSKLQIVVDVPGRLVDNIREGDELTASIDGHDGDISVKVTKIFPTSDPVRHTKRVELTLPRGNKVTAGTYAEVRVPVAGTDVADRLVLPQSAIVQRGGMPAVFVVNEKNNKVHLKMVRIGDMLPTGEVVILYGVEENNQILNNPASYITSGYTVNLE